VPLTVAGPGGCGHRLDYSAGTLVFF